MKLPSHLEKELPELKGFIDRSIQVEGLATEEKAQCMEPLLGLYRASQKNLDASITFEEKGVEKAVAKFQRLETANNLQQMRF